MRQLLSAAVVAVCAAVVATTGASADGSRPVRVDADRSAKNQTIVLQFSVGPNCTQKSTRDGVMDGSCCYDCFGFYGLKMTASASGDVVTRDTFGVGNYNCTGKPATRTDFEVDTCCEGFDPSGVGVVISVQPSH